MTWNYRVIKHDDDPDPRYHRHLIHRVHDNKRGRVSHWSQRPAFAGGESRDELLRDLDRMYTDCETLDVLSLSELERDASRWHRRLWRWFERQKVRFCLWWDRHVTCRRIP